MRITRAVVPSLFTVLNIVCGFLSLTHTGRGEYSLAAWFIITAGVFDVLDGIMARITKSSSDFGVELDSLSDVVSFGVAPSFLVYSLHLNRLEGMGVLLGAMPMVFGAIRLARFNVSLTGYDKDYFTGLPIPATAITLSSFVLSLSNDVTGLQGFASDMLAPLTAVLSLLMVSTIKYDTLPKFSRRGIVQHPLRFTAGIVGLTAIVLTQGRALFPVFILYVATGPLRYIVHFVARALRPSDKPAENEDAEITSVDV